MKLRKKSVWGLFCLLFVSLTMTSCFGDAVVYEYSSDATVHSFELDDVLGVNYKFTIDHGAGKIYNIDSLPVQSDTIIDRILIKTLSIMNYATVKSSEGLDSLLTISDSLDLRGTMEVLPDGTPGKPFVFKVWAPDGIHTKEYQLSVRVHQQHADSLNWGNGPVLSGFTSLTGKQKAVLLGDDIWVFFDKQHTRAVSGSRLNPGGWSEKTLSGLPADYDYASVLAYGGRLYALSASGEVYQSEDAVSWTKNEALSMHHVSGLLAAFPDGSAMNSAAGIAAIVYGEGGASCFAKTNPEATAWAEIAEEVPAAFPGEHLSSAVYENNLGVSTAVLVGEIPEELTTASDTSTVAWTTTDGLSWYPLVTESSYDCPKLTNPSILHYGEQFYIFGSDFSAFYRSKDGLVWEKVEERFMFPEAIRGKASNYSVVVDGQDYIWIMRDTPCEVWKGRLNELGFQVR